MLRRSVFIALLAAMAVLLAACGGGAQQPEEIVLGHMGPLTGPAAFLGQEQLGFTQVAVEIFNEETGMNVQVAEGDTEIQADTGQVVADRFVADASILAVVGPAGSQVCEATMPTFAEAGLAHITPSCTRTSLTQDGTATDTFFRPIPTDAAQGPTDATFMVEELGAESVFLLDDQSSYAVGLNDETEASLNDLGVTDIQRASVTQEETDMSSVATAVNEMGADVVFFPSQNTGQIGTLIVQLRELGWEGTYFLADGGFATDWIEAAGEAAEGSYVSLFSRDSHEVPEMEEYNTRYQDQFGDFSAFGGPSALAARVALEAIQRCSEAGTLTRQCTLDEIAATDIDNGILGYPVSFDGNGQLEGGEFTIYEVVDGAFQLAQ